MKKILLIAILFFSVSLHSQDIPLPNRCLPLNKNTEGLDIMTGQVFKLHGKVTSLTDRFGISGNAISFGSDNSYLELPLIAQKQAMQGVTLTFWMYIDGDSVAQAFWGKDTKGDVIWGMHTNGKRAVLDIYHKDKNQTILPDRQWMWDDSNFEEGNGWYQVAISYTPRGTYFYLTSPKGKMSECYSAFVPDWDQITSMGIGATTGIVSLGMDDFKMYYSSLSKEQITMLHQSESQMTLGDAIFFNVDTRASLLGSSWYLHCIGMGVDQMLQYKIQKADNLTFLQAGNENVLTTTDDLNSTENHATWGLYPQGDTVKGRLFILNDNRSGMNITAVSDVIILQGANGTDNQKWCMGSVATLNKTVNKEKVKNLLNVRENIYFDLDENLIKISILLPEAEDIQVNIYDNIGRLVGTFSENQKSSFEKSIKPSSTGVYVITLNSDSYNFSKKVNVTSW